jgi:hypothetical protein
MLFLIHDQEKIKENSNKNKIFVPITHDRSSALP